MYWASRLKREGRVVGPRGAERRDSKGEVERGGFVELIGGPIEERRFEIELADGRRVRVPPAFDAAALERLLGVLASMGR